MAATHKATKGSSPSGRTAQGPIKAKKWKKAGEKSVKSQADEAFEKEAASVSAVREPHVEKEAPAEEKEERTSYDADTAIKLYLREIGQVKLLTPGEEVELAARIKKGDKKAREQMIKANLRLVDQAIHQARPSQPIQDHPAAGAFGGQDFQDAQDGLADA